MNSKANRTVKNNESTHVGSQSKKATNGKKRTAKGNSKKSKASSSPPTKKAKVLDPRLHPIKRIVEGQKNAALQSLLFKFAEETLISLMAIHKKERGIAKLRGNDEYVPGSVDFKATLQFPSELKNTEATNVEISGWETDILNCKKALTKRILSQAERTLLFMKTKLQRDVIGQIINIGCIIAAREKIIKDLGKSNMNADAIAKGATMNFFTSLSWLEIFTTVTDPSFVDTNIKKVLFVGNDKDTEVLFTTTCRGGTTAAPWEKLLHKRNREDYRKKVSDKMVAVVNSQLELSQHSSDTVSSISSNSRLTKLEWNGEKYIKVAQPSMEKSPIEIWKQMEEEAAQEDMEESTEEDVSQEEDAMCDRADQLLCDEVMKWMVETIPPILTIPYNCIKSNSIQNRANAAIKNVMENNNAHKLADKIEEALEEDKAILRIGQEEFDKKVNTAVNRKVNELIKKNSLGGGVTTSPNNIRNGDSGKNGRKLTKKQKAIRAKKKVQQEEKRKTTKVNPYKKKTKKQNGKFKKGKGQGKGSGR